MKDSCKIECIETERLVEMHSDIKWIKQEIIGNGKKGLINKIDDNTRWRYITLGGLLVTTAFVGWLISIIR